MKLKFTIFFLVCLFRTYAQTDSLLQHLIDSVKSQINKPAPVVKDTQQHVVKINKPKKDTTKSVTIFSDSLSTSDGIKTRSLPHSLQKDSTDSVAAVAMVPSLAKAPLTWQEDTAFMLLLEMPVGNLKTHAFLKEGDIHLSQQKDHLFYFLVGVVLFLAIIRQLFPKYFQNMFRILFQASFRQKQTRELLMQETLPSLLLNILFIIVAGLFIALLADMNNINKRLNIPFWWATLYSIIMLALIYMLKYVVIQFMGWVFNAKEPATTYGFIVFLINKAIGLALLPLLLLLAFSTGHFQEITLTVAAIVVTLLLLFRYIISLTVIRGTLSIHPLHFFIYLCGVELMPMLIIYKALFNYIGKSNY